MSLTLAQSLIAGPADPGWDRKIPVGPASLPVISMCVTGWKPVLP